MGTGDEAIVGTDTGDGPVGPLSREQVAVAAGALHQAARRRVRVLQVLHHIEKQAGA